MSRRFFLKTAAAWPIAAAATGAKAAQLAAPLAAPALAPLLAPLAATFAAPATSPVAVPPATPAPAAARRVELQRSAVAGFQYHQGEWVWDLIREGDMLTLEAEPTNPHDARAVRVLWQGLQLGYVPRVDNAAVCHLLQTGHTVQAQIVRRQDSANPWHRLEMAVYLQAG